MDVHMQASVVIMDSEWKLGEELSDELMRAQRIFYASYSVANLMAETMRKIVVTMGADVSAQVQMADMGTAQQEDPEIVTNFMRSVMPDSPDFGGFGD